MARGRIPERDIAAIRERTPIEEVVGEYVQLKPAGSDSLKGLSPFKDEKTPSFHVRPNKGYYHCFSTGEGGDVFSFLMKMEQLSFPEAVEQCAERIGYRINYEGGGPRNQVEPGTRQRLIAANRAAHEFYQQQLLTDEAQPARQFLLDRGFSPEHAQEFGCGYAPGGWDTLTKHLLRKGFDVKELVAAGLSSQGKRGHIDRFHRRLLWPIRSTSNDVIGFGARKLFDDDKMGKYMNTPDTMLYHKSKVLFGIDLAKKHIANEHQAVIVEGYTDVMAMHAAGVKTAVAACGTAFGAEHLQLIRRLMLDDNFLHGEIIYTFDGDEAGQKAAMRAFEGNQEFSGHSFVSVAPDGQDPCDLRLGSGDAAVRDLVAQRIPMYEFVLRTTIDTFSLSTPDGRLTAIRRVVPIVAGIKDSPLRDAYARKVAGWIGWENVDEVVGWVRQEAKKPSNSATPLKQTAAQRAAAVANTNTAGANGPAAGNPNNTTHSGSATSAPQQPASQQRFTRPKPNDPRYFPQREALKLAIQEPGIAGGGFDQLDLDCFTHPTYRLVAETIRTIGGCRSATNPMNWIETIAGELPEAIGQPFTSELALEPLYSKEKDIPDYAEGIFARLLERWVAEQIAELKATMERMNPHRDHEQFQTYFSDLVALEQYKRSLGQRAIWD